MTKTRRLPERARSGLPRRLWRAFAHDPWYQVGLAVLVLTTTPYWVPGIDPAWRMYYGDYWTEQPLVFFALVVLVVRARASTLPREARFWRLWAIALGLWFVAMFGKAVIPRAAWDHFEASLSLDAIYTAFYLCIVISLELHPLRRPEDLNRRLKAFETTGGLVMIFAAVFYFLLIPLRMNPGSIGYYGPSLQMYVVVDVYLALRFIALARREVDHLRPAIYLVFAAAMSWNAFTDTFEYLSWSERIPWLEGGSPLDFLWFPPYVLIVIAARQSTRALQDVVPQQPSEGLSQTPVRAGLLLVYAGAFPFLHALLYELDLLDPATERARLLASTIFMLILTGLAVTYQRLMDAERGRLEVDRLLEMQNHGTTRKMAALGRMAGGIAHDFNNLLTVISGSRQILKATTAEDAPENEWLDEIDRATQRASLLTKQLLAFSRQQPQRPKVFTVEDLLAANVRPIRTLLGRAIALEIRHRDEIAWVRVDPGQFQRVLLNLASNARDAMPTGGRLLIESSSLSLPLNAARPRDLAPGEYVVLEVTDGGQGLDDTALNKLFEPFFTTKLNGTGLGLATCFGIMRQLDGFIEGANSETDGACFRLYLPAIEEPDTEEIAPLDDLIPTAPPRATATVLLAEDESAIRKLMSHMLKEDGYTILEAGSGEEALAVAAAYSEPIDLLLTDVVMPGMSGPELAHKLARSRPEMRIAYCSGNPQGRHLTTHDPHGEVPFLAKPFDRATLAEFVENTLSPEGE